MIRPLFSALVILTAAATAFPAVSDTVGVPYTGAPGIVESVEVILAREALAPRSTVMRKSEAEKERPDRRNLPQSGLSPAVPLYPPSPDALPVASPSEGPLAPQPVGTSFQAATSVTSGSIPPDTQGDVSPTQIMLGINGRIRIFNKAGALGVLDVSADSFFGSVRGTDFTSDPRVRFDRLSQRWFITIVTVAFPNRILIAVSNDATVGGTSTFTFFQFQQDVPGGQPNADTGALADYATLGVDANALYIGMNSFSSSGAYRGTTGFVVRKSALLASPATLVVTAFRQLAPASGPGPYTPQGVSNDDASATTGLFIGVDNAMFGLLVARRVSNPGGTPSISGNINITVPTTSFPISVPHPGSTCPLDALDDRLFVAKASHGILVTAHNIQVNASGVASAAGGRVGSRWYQLGNLAGGPTLLESGTLFDSTASQPRSYFIPSAARSGQGHMALGASVAGPTVQAGAAVAGRWVTDPAGTLQAPTIAQAGSASYNVQTCDSDTFSQRWGDYTQTSVDPADDMTMWTFQQYVHASNGYAIRVIQLLAPPPATPVSILPSSLQQGTVNVNVAVTGTASGASAFFDPGAGFPNRIAASVSGTGVTVNSVTVTDATHVTLNLTVSPTAPTGVRTVTITNPDGQSATMSGFPLSIVPCPAPSGAVTGAALACTNSVGNTATAGEAGATYAWTIVNGTITAGASAQTVTYSTGGTSPVVLNLTVTKNNCQATGSKTVNVVNRPLASATGGGTICTGGSRTLQGNGGTSCSWSPATGLSNASSCTPVASPASTQVYSLTVTDANGCSSTNTSQVTVGVNTRPTAVATGGATICAGSSTPLQGSGGSGCSWTPATGLSSASVCAPQASPGTTTTYTLTVTGANGCASTNAPQVTVNVTPKPAAPTISGSASACIGAPFTLTATAGYAAYQWFKNGNPIGGATQATYGKASATAGDAGSYTVNGTSSGCTSLVSGALVLSVSTCQGPSPTIASVVPSCANVTGGRSVTITGTNYQTGATVKLGGVNATVTSQSASSLVVTVPARASTPALPSDVQVTNPDAGTTVLPGAFTYVVRGDANNNGAVTPADSIYLNLFVFLGGSPPATLCNGDANANGSITPADSIFLNLYVFLGGAAPGP